MKLTAKRIKELQSYYEMGCKYAYVLKNTKVDTIIVTVNKLSKKDLESPKFRILALNDYDLYKIKDLLGKHFMPISADFIAINREAAKEKKWTETELRLGVNINEIFCWGTRVKSN